MNAVHIDYKNKQKRIGAIVLAILVVIAGIIFIDQSPTETLAIKTEVDGVEVFINRSPATADEVTDTKVTYNLSPGTYKVLVANKNFWPWRTKVSIATGTTATISPYLVSTQAEVIKTPKDSLKQALRQAGKTVTDKDNPIISPNEDIRAYIYKDKNVIAQWRRSTSTAPAYFGCYQGVCGVSVFYKPKVSVNQIAFYPGRSDALIFATDTAVWAIEINPTGLGQNFRPIIRHITNPVFTIKNDTIFIKHGGKITAVEL